MKKNILALTILISFLNFSCHKNIVETILVEDAVNQMPLAGVAVNTSAWTSGSLPITTDITQQILPTTSLLPLNVSYSGNKIFKCNNPEIVRGNGWLMQNARTDAGRGGATFALSGTNTAYLFHINKSGATKYIHLLVSNPNAAAITVSSKGSYYNNIEKPLSIKATGPSYFVAKDWLNNTLRQPQTTATSIAQGTVKEIFKIVMNNNNLVDGRFEITTSGNAYYYTVITSTGNLADAINASQGSFAAGDYFTESANAYGREAGIYEFTQINADNSLTLPSLPSYMGFALNTANKFFPTLENQTTAALMTMSGAATKSYGNYGHRYSVKFNITNSSNSNKTLKLYFASNAINAAQTNATWNGPIKMNNAVIDVYTALNAPRQQLSTWTIQPGQFNVTLDFFVPGLITTNQQLIFETN